MPYYYYDTHGFTDTPKKMEHLHTQDFGIHADGWFFKKSFRIFDYEWCLFIKDEPPTSASSFTMSDDPIINDSIKYGKDTLPTPHVSGDAGPGNKYFDLPRRRSRMVATRSQWMVLPLNVLL